jgi:NAD(P)-dependent dehydrogenase (short-subunit alcohol dehydrogenase family)
MSGKVCLVTGATAGIGAVAARAIAERGANVVIVGRNPSKCEATADEIRRSTGNSAVEFIVGDISSQAGVRDVAGQFLARHARLDVLLNNAGAVFAHRRESVDGIEMTLALNHLGYFLLTHLLLDALKASAPSRVVNVASDAHTMVRGIDLDDLQGVKRYRGFRAYSQSKLANILFTYELAHRLEGTGVTANALHPGFVATSFFNGNGFLGWLMRRGASLFAIRPENGARTSIYLATSPEVERTSGRYFVKERPAESSRASRDGDTARRLWRLSEELTGISSPAH